MRNDPRRRLVQLLSALLLAAALVGLPPGAARAQAPAAEAEPAPPLARANRLAVSFGFGLGSVAMGRLHDLAGDAIDWVKRQNPGLSVDGELGSNFQVNAEFGVRYYFPYHVLAHVGYGALYNWASAPLTFGPLRTEAQHYNVLMEVPILVGGYYTFIDRLYVYGAVGPDVFFFSRSYWDVEQGGGLPDFKADSGAGFIGLVGADFLLAQTFGLGLEVRYRYLVSKSLVELDSGIAPATLGIGSGSYELDFSGVSVGLYLRLFAM